jgi:single-strand DNA-binding protein
MRSINKVILIGNLTRDPEMRQTPNGQSVTTFGMATNREWTTKGGERNNSAEFHECVSWAHLAEICQKYLRKGHLVYVEGYLKTRSWDSPEGIKKFKTEIVVKDMIRLEKRPKEAGNEPDYIPPEETEHHHDEPHRREAPVRIAEKPAVVVEAPTQDDTSSNGGGSFGDDPISKDLGL